MQVYFQDELTNVGVFLNKVSKNSWEKINSQ